MTVTLPEREHLLEQYGRFYGDQRFAVTFTAAIEGDDAKRVRGPWDRTGRLADGNFGAALVGNRGKTRNPAIVLRPSELIVLECDTEDDLHRIQTLNLPETLTVRSSQPYKRHFYFRPDPAMEMLPYVAFRFESGKITADTGRYFLAPPAIHPSGAVYSFLPGRGPTDLPIAELPEQLYRQIADQARAESAAQRESIRIDPEAKIREGNRRDYIFRYACMQRRWGLSEQQILEAALVFNQDRCQPPLTRDQVAMQVHGAMQKQGGQEIQAAQTAVTPDEPEPSVTGPILVSETWRTFEQSASDHVPTLVQSIWPEGALGFIASPPKKGKTWIAIALALSVSTGRRYLGRFYVPAARNVTYVALEGHRASLRGRFGCIARGMGLNPETDELERLHMVYKPRGINIANVEWAQALHRHAEETDSALIIVDVLRAAAQIKENSPEEFGYLRNNLEPLLANGRSVALLHHFGKLTEITKERTPGERMTGSGAMYGAMDVGVFITGSQDGARNLRLEFEMRDIAGPDTLGVHLEGEGSGDNGGFIYTDTATFTINDDVPEEEDVKAPAVEILEYVLDNGGEVPAKQIREYFEISDHTLTRRIGRLRALGIDYVAPKGKAARLVAREPEIDPAQTTLEEVIQTSEVATSEEFGRRDFPAQPSHSEVRTNTSEVTPLRTSKSGDLQEHLTSEPPNSPTERTPLPGAVRISEHHSDPADDLELPPIDETIAPEYEDPSTNGHGDWTDYK